LRELLQISGTYGSYNTKILGVITEDKGVQTRTEGEPEKDDSEEDELRKDPDVPEPEEDEGFAKETPPVANMYVNTIFEFHLNPWNL